MNIQINLYSKVIFLLLGFAILFSSCGKDGCTSPYAENYDINALEDDGSCILERDKLLGNYVSAIEWNYNGVLSNEFSIIKGEDIENVVRFVNLLGSNDSFTGQVSGDEIIINVTVDDLELRGTGIIERDIIKLELKLTDTYYYVDYDYEIIAARS